MNRIQTSSSPPPAPPSWPQVSEPPRSEPPEPRPPTCAGTSHTPKPPTPTTANTLPLSLLCDCVGGGSVSVGMAGPYVLCAKL